MFVGNLQRATEVHVGTSIRGAVAYQAGKVDEGNIYIILMGWSYNVLVYQGRMWGMSMDEWRRWLVNGVGPKMDLVSFTRDCRVSSRILPDKKM